MKGMKKFQFLVASLTTLLVANAASAHTGMGATSGFSHGLAHPLGGLDHLLAMIAVGLWASQLAQSRNAQGHKTQKSALWVVPLSFVALMIAGGVLGAEKIALPFVETGILMSVLVLGVLVAAAVRLPILVSVVVVGGFALFHGHAHGAEMPESANGLLYGAGFVIATILLHAIGVGLGIVSQKKLPAPTVRFAGAAIALCSVMLFLPK